MPKVTVEYNLPEEREEYADHMRGPDFIYAIQDFDNWLRSIIKYDTTKNTEVYEEVRTKLHSFIGDKGQSIWG